MSIESDILLETGTNEVEIAEFCIQLPNNNSYSSFGINVAKIREIIQTPDYMKMPNSDDNVLGVFRLRDKIIPIIDLGKWLKYKPGSELENTYVIVTEFNKDNFGFLVHKIEKIHRVSWEEVLPPAEMNNEIQGDCVTGVVLLGENKEKIMMMVDFEKIVSEINPSVGLGVLKEEKVASFNFGNSHPKALLAEDSTLIRKYLTDILTKGGFEVVAVNNGKLAWDYVKKWKKQSKDNNIPINDIVKIVVTDIEMPQMDGHALLRNIKEDADLNNIPVILFSSLIYEEMRKKGEEIGADAQISKPEIANLLSVVQEVLQQYEN